MQFVQLFQVGDCGYLQETEITYAGITKIGDVAMKRGSPVIVLGDTRVAQQVVPPSERTRAFFCLRSHGHLSKRQRKTGASFRSANLSDVMLFRSCAARFMRCRLRLSQSINAGGCSVVGTTPPCAVSGPNGI
jgi:hypothetical protein